MADAEHAAPPGEPPPVRDEAADTPMWLPIVGLCLLVFGTLMVLWQSRSTPEEVSEEAAEEAAPVEGEAAPEGAPAAEGAAAPQPAAPQPAPAPPAEHDHPH